MPLKRLVATVAVLGGLAAPATAAAASTVTGRITYLGGSSFAIQTPGRTSGVINAMIATANAVSAKVYPYVYGGGHAQAGIPSVGIPGPGYNGRRRGFDCSGSVAAVLAGANLWAPGSGVPNDAGVVAQLRQQGLIAPGPGSAPNEVNLYDDPGVHIFMSINGRFFGTSDGGGGNPKGGPTWLDDGAPYASSRIYKRYHLLPSALRSQASSGQVFAFEVGYGSSLVSGATVGEKVTVTYRQTPTGAMIATGVSVAGASTASGTVTALSGSSLSIVPAAGGPALTLTLPAGSDLAANVQVGDGVQVTYAKDAAGHLVVHALQVTSTAAPASGSGQPAPSGSGQGYSGPPVYGPSGFGSGGH